MQNIGITLFKILKTLSINYNQEYNNEKKFEIS